MKICIVTSVFPRSLSPARGGVETYVETLAKVLAASGAEVHVLEYQYAFSNEETPAVPVVLHQVRLRYIPYFSTAFPNLYEAWQVRRALSSLDNQEHFDVIEGANDEGMMVFVASAFGNRFWMRLHTSLRQHIVNKQQNFTWRRRFAVWLDRRSARQAQHLATHSAIHRAEMASEYGINQQKIALVPHAVSAPPVATRGGEHQDNCLYWDIGPSKRHRPLLARRRNSR